MHVGRAEGSRKGVLSAANAVRTGSIVRGVG